MDATQAPETRIITRLRFNGDELEHLCLLAGGGDMAMRAVGTGWKNPANRVLNNLLGETGAWLARWYQEWKRSHDETQKLMPMPVGTVPGPGPDIEVTATPDQMEMLCKIAAEERFLSDVPKCGWLHAQLRDLACHALSPDTFPDDDAPPKTGYHIPTEQALRNLYSWTTGYGSVGSVTITVKDWARGGGVLPLADPAGHIFAIVCGLNEAEARLMVDALNTWS